jgi:hypothetical protein
LFASERPVALWLTASFAIRMPSERRRRLILWSRSGRALLGLQRRDRFGTIRPTGIMPIAKIACGLVALCEQARFIEAIENYFSENVESIEPVELPGIPRICSGKQQVIAKNRYWLENHRINSVQIDGPFIGEAQFALRYHFDYTVLKTGKRQMFVEMALYTVQGSKIVLEEFYYPV